MLERAKRCPRCGTYPDEFTAGDASNVPYEAVSVRCRGCELIDLEKDSWKDAASEARGISIRLEHKDELLPWRPEMRRGARSPEVGSGC